MDWKTVASKVADAAPLLGSLLGGPAGATVGALLASALGTGATPDAVSAVLADPQAAVKLREIEASRQVQLQQLVVDQAKADLAAQTAQVQAVNATMQAEASAQHWPTYSWRPFIGFVFGAYIASMFVLPLFGKQPVALTPDLVLAIGAILGVASYFRGKMQADPRVPSDNRG